MYRSKHFSFACFSAVIMILICFIVVPSWAGALLLAACVALFCAVFLFFVRKAYLELEENFRRTADSIRLMAYYDDLTGLPNRRYAREQLEQALLHQNRIIAVFNVDIDRFRIFNDTLGHDFGDIILLQAAERLTRCARSGDTVARMEGDKFILIYPQLNEVSDIEEIARRIHDVFASPFTFQDYQLHTSVNIGVAVNVTSGDNVSADALIKYAGLALSKAQEQKNVSYELYTPAMDRQSLEKLTLENELRRAIESGEFILHYQPQVEIETGKILGVEALIRWQHPERGIISPAIFIPVAEENGLITLIDEWVMKEACRYIKKLHETGYPELHVAVNISSRQFIQQDLVERVARVLAETNLEPRYLELEITESMTMDVERSIQILRELKDLGVRISIDDFGTGYSSLNYLKKFPIHKLKIDRSFVHDIMEDPSDASIVSTIISMAHHLNMRVIAEGVETADQLRYLKRNECNEIQGYLFSPPLSGDDLIKLLDHNVMSPFP